jgi:hypothetical protein
MKTRTAQLTLVDRAPAPIPRDEHGYPRHVYIAENELWCSWGSDGDTFGEVASLPWDEAVSVFRQWWIERQEQAERQAEARTRRAVIREVKP